MYLLQVGNLAAQLHLALTFDSVLATYLDIRHGSFVRYMPSH